MKVITFITQKGGTGKTTLAVSLAVAAHQAGHKVFVLDMDPQESATSWYRRREADEPGVDKLAANQLQPALNGLRENGYDYIIIDTAGTDTPATAAAIKASDLCLVPARPSVLDIEASKPTVASMLQLRREFAFVLNQCPAGRNMRVNDASTALNIMGHLAEPAFVTRADHVDAVGAGQGVTERDPGGKAAQEIELFYEWIERRTMGVTHAA